MINEEKNNLEPESRSSSLSLEDDKLKFGLQKKRRSRFSVRLWHGALVLFLVALIAGVSFLYLPKVHASTYTWDGGGINSNWSTPENWSTDTAPLATDSVIFDNSLCGVNCNATIDAGFQGTVANLTIAADYAGTITEAKDLIVTGDFSLAGGTFNAVSYTISVGGNYGRTGGTFTAGTSTLKMTSTSTGKTFTAGGQTYNNLTFDGVGGGWTLQDALALTAATGTLTLSNGTLSTNGQTLNIGIMSSSGSSARTLTLGASQINLSGTSANVWSMGAGTGLTLNADTSTITFTGTNPTAIWGVGKIYNNVVFSGNTGSVMDYSPTFANLTINSAANKTSSLILWPSGAGGGTYTVTGTLTLNGSSPTNRLLVQSNTLGTARTFNAAAVSLSNVDFMDITAAGAASPFTGTSIGDAGGNTNITFDAPVTQTWNGTTGNWSDNTKWTSRVPLPQDDVVLAGTNTVTADMPRIGKSISFTGATPLTLGNTVTSYGSLDFTGSGVLTSGSNYWYTGGRGAYLLTSAGKTFFYLFLRAPGGSLTAQDATVCSGMLVYDGDWDAGVYSFTVNSQFSTMSGTAKVISGSGTWTITGDQAVTFDIRAGNPTWNATGPLVFAYTGASDRNYTFGTSRTIPNAINITGGGAGIAYLQATTAATFTGLVTVNAPKTVKFDSGVTYNLNDISLNGSAGNVITMLASTPGSAATLNYTGTKRAQVVYGDITDINVTPASTWYYDTNTTINSGTGWTSGIVVKTFGNVAGNWSDATKWIGGVKPIAGDDVVFDANSASCVLNENSAALRSLDMTGYTGTLSGSATAILYVTNSAAGTTIDAKLGGTLTVTTFFLTASNATAIIRLTSNGLATQNMWFYGTGGGKTVLQDDLTLPNIAGSLVNLQSNSTSLDLNGKTIAGYNATTARGLVKASTLGTASIPLLNGGTFANMDFMDIGFNNGGADLNLSGITGLSGDAGGNSMVGGGNLTLTSPVTQTWNGTTGSWSDNTKWTSRVPLPQDDVVLAGTNTVTADMPRIGKSISFTGATPLTLGNAVTSYGSLNFTNAGAFTGAYTWAMWGRGNYLLTSAGKTFPQHLSMSPVGGSITLQDNLATTNAVVWNDGTLNTGVYSITTQQFQSNANRTRTFNGSGAINLPGANGLNISSLNMTWSHTGPIAMTYAGASANTWNINTTYVPMVIPNPITVTGGGAGVFYLQATTSAVTFNGSFTVNAPKTVKFTSGVTYNFAQKPVLTGSAGNLITMLSSTPASAATLNYTGSGLVLASYANITDINVTPAATWYYDENSTLNSGTGWNTDWVDPIAPAYVSVAPTGYSALNHFEFTWPVVPPNGPTDAGSSGLWKFQYRIGFSGAWTDVPGDETTATIALDDAAALGLNTFNLIVLDNVGNASNSVRTNFYFNDTAPTAPPNLSVTPLSNTVNEFAFAWDASPGEIAGYYYSVNNIPTLQNANWTTSLSLSSNAYATQQGENIMYVVAKDVAGNYDFSGCGPGSVGYNPNTDICAAVAFSASTAAPGLAGNLQAFDISNRAAQEYTVALKWDTPATPVTGFAGYDIYRSTDGVAYTLLGETTGTTYADNNVVSQIYFYKLKTRDNAGQVSAFTSPIFITPTGAFTTPPVLVSGPTFTVQPTSITIVWATDREASSLVTIKEGNTFVGEQGQTEQVTAHSVKVVGLRAQNEYTFTISSTDIDGNTMTGSEQTFTTANTPAVYDLNLSNLTQSSVYVNFKSTASANFTMYYGESTDYGATTAEPVGSATTNHSLSLADLKSGQAYFFRVLGEDSDGNELRSENSFTTLPMPEINDFKIEPVKDAPTTTLKVTWKTNVATSTILKYSADGTNFSEKVLAELTIDHEITIEDLRDSSTYVIFGAGRDQFGNMAVSNQITFNTPADSRAPEISDVIIESSNVGNISGGKAQIAVSWKTDEAASSQVEYDTGISGDEYTKKTVADGAFTNQHLVIIGDLDPGAPYHLRVVSADMSGNEVKSTDNTVITGDVAQSALQIILDTLMRIFGWMGKLIK